jgi:hypothetical protein
MHEFDELVETRCEARNLRGFYRFSPTNYILDPFSIVFLNVSPHFTAPFRIIIDGAIPVIRYRTILVHRIVLKTLVLGSPAQQVRDARLLIGAYKTYETEFCGFCRLA